MTEIRKNENAGVTEVNLEPAREYKSRLFEMIYSEKKALLELYNAANNTHYDDPEQLEINTLKNAIYMAMRNDVSFIIDSTVNLYEHQSTYSPNLPLRCLMYISDLYSVYTKDKNLYGIKLVELPTPHFLVFYNGQKELPEKLELRLSDAFIIKEEEIFLELKLTLLNINPGYNEELKKLCKTLGDYAEYTARVRSYAQTMKIEDAVERAITECIREGILSEFLSKNRMEAKKMSIYEYDQEKHMRQEREEHWRDGHEAGLREGHEIGVREGHQSGMREGIIMGKIEMCQDLGLSVEETIIRLADKFLFKEDEVKEYIKKYWK